MIRSGTLFLLVLTVAMPATATTVYKCIARNGQVSYQGTPCPSGQRQHTMQLVNPPPASPSSAQPASQPVAEQPAAPPPPSQPPPVSPPPRIYRCVRATDGTTYLSRDGHPAPYLAPLGMLGIVPNSLAQTYSAANHMGHGKVTAGLVADRYTTVRDDCRELSPDETCQALRDASNANQAKLLRAFHDQEPALKQYQAELDSELAHCSGHP